MRHARLLGTVWTGLFVLALLAENDYLGVGALV